jgi:hypothetical protein
MDYVNGHVIETLKDRGIKKKVFILDYLTSIRSIIFGFFSSCFSRGIIFPDIEDLFFNDTVEEWPEPPHQKERGSGTIICICMAANYLAVYYLKGQHKNTHTTPPLHAYIHTCRRQVGSFFL